MGKDIIYRLAVFFFLIFGYLSVFGQECHETSIRFHVGQWMLDETLGGNARRLSEIVTFLQKVESDPELELAEVAFCGSASPEGRIKLNRMLAVRRREALENYVRSRVSLPDSIVTRRDNTLDWGELLRLIEASDMPHKAEAADVIRRVPEFSADKNGMTAESRKAQLMKLHNGSTWQHMLRNFFPRIRSACFIAVTVRKKPEPDIVEAVKTEELIEVIDTVRIEPLPLPEAVFTGAKPDTAWVAVEERRPVIWAIKTNLLYDVITLPNLGVEVRLDDRWSIHSSWMYGWWNNNFSRHYFLRAYGGEVSLRRWFGSRIDGKPFTGHHVGIYGQLFTYDFRKGDHGYMGGRPGGTLWDKISYAAGVEYGYSLPLHRRLRLDFSAGVGYQAGVIHDYTPEDGCKVWQRTRNRRRVGPTKVEISLLWLIGKGGVYDD